MLGFSIKIEGMEELKKTLTAPFRSAMAKTLNSVAESINKEQEKIAESSFKTFGRYSRRSLFTWKTKGDRPMLKQNAVVGSFSPYLARLERGFQPKPFQINAKTGLIEKVTGRPIPSRASRKSDGTLKRKYTFKKMTTLFFLRIKNETIGLVREGTKIKRVRIIKETTAPVKPYKWHEKAVNKIYKPGLLQELFAKYFYQK